MPKVLKMRQPEQHRKSKDHTNLPEPLAPECRDNLLQFPDNDNEHLHVINRWVDLADQVLGNNKRMRKRA